MMIFDDDEDKIFFFAEALFRTDMKTSRMRDASEDVENTVVCNNLVVFSFWDFRTFF
jgi:hypothetical protein